MFSGWWAVERHTVGLSKDITTSAQNQANQLAAMPSPNYTLEYMLVISIENFTFVLAIPIVHSIATIIASCHCIYISSIKEMLSLRTFDMRLSFHNIRNHSGSGLLYLPHALRNRG